MNDVLRLLSLTAVAMAERLRRVFESRVVSGALVSVAVANGATAGTAFHGLGRPHNGAAVVAGPAGYAGIVQPATDSTSVALTLTAAAGADLTFQLWVF